MPLHPAQSVGQICNIPPRTMRSGVIGDGQSGHSFGLACAEDRQASKDVEGWARNVTHTHTHTHTHNTHTHTLYRHTDTMHAEGHDQVDSI
jgi:hypothetical protein